jgi:cell division protein FtsW (lipid II flippase)
MFIKVKTGDNNSNSDSNNKTYSLANIILTIASLIIILIIAFSDDFKKNKALLMNYTIIFVLLLVSCVVYLFSTKNDYVSFNKLPKWDAKISLKEVIKINLPHPVEFDQYAS